MRSYCEFAERPAGSRPKASPETRAADPKAAASPPTPDGGRVSVAGRRINGSVEIAVDDTGIGIAEQDLDRIFNEFQQLDSGPDRQHQGTGLGLALTRRFAELHGGRVEVRSSEGGSTFTLVLPQQARAPDRELRDNTTPASAVEKGWPLVLIVEDNREAADLLIRHLAKGGYRAEVAWGGRDVIEKARRLRPIAITLDILLPDLDGWELLNTLKRDRQTRDIPILRVSGFNLGDWLSHCRFPTPKRSHRGRH